jgi:hypothetical protein
MRPRLEAVDWFFKRAAKKLLFDESNCHPPCKEDEQYRLVGSPSVCSH